MNVYNAMALWGFSSVENQNILSEINIEQKFGETLGSLQVNVQVSGLIQISLSEN